MTDDIDCMILSVQTVPSSSGPVFTNTFAFDVPFRAMHDAAIEPNNIINTAANGIIPRIRVHMVSSCETLPRLERKHT
ncbi:MAG: hypothetical protein NC041_05570 [Bacteroides sp.]|nr:hypothetical protein [Prevotella sp.]MCM1407426.1 hypothetical protein [Treponema brennaborense]MCM1469916.1 hypothetical protein [Bacteroides sp.]